MSIINFTRQTSLATHTEIADTPLKRLRGLLGRKALPVNHALVIRPCQSIHMFFMRFAIDVIFLDKNQHVIGLCAHIKPFQLSPIFWKSSCAIELSVGTIDKTHTQIGDRININ